MDTLAGTLGLEDSTSGSCLRLMLLMGSTSVSCRDDDSTALAGLLWPISVGRLGSLLGEGGADEVLTGTGSCEVPFGMI